MQPLQNISIERALDLILEHVPPVGVERVSLGMALGTVLKETIAAEEAMPSFHRSAMDGYAVVYGDKTDELKIVEEILMGKVPRETIQIGSCARIYTGGMIPEGATAVVPRENVERVGERIRVLKWEKNDFVRRAGDEAAQGEILIEQGKLLDAVDLGILASVGVVSPKISLPVRVVHFTSGNEVIAPEEKPKRGEIRNSNRILMQSLLEKNGVRLIVQDHLLEDREAAFGRLIQVPSESYDLLLISGGASVGDHDGTKELLRKLGYRLLFESLNLRPGKPLICGVKGSKMAFGIPGNPVSHFVLYHLFIKPLISLMRGESGSISRRSGLLVKREIDLNPRRTFYPARVLWKGDQYQVEPLNWKNSGNLVGLRNCTGLVDVAAGQGKLSLGERVEWMTV